MLISRASLPALLCGLMATLTGVGVARFAYAALLPGLVDHGWFNSQQAAWLGAANLFGYLLGALSANRLASRFGNPALLAMGYLLCAGSFLLCVWPAGFLWFSGWRLLAGVGGAWLMVVGPSLAFACVPVAQRPTLAAWVFTGIGLGTLLSATLVPALLAWPPGLSWLLLGLLCSLAGALGLLGVRRLRPLLTPPSGTHPSHSTHSLPAGRLALLVIAAYALDALAFVPHTVFWVDYLARELELGQVRASGQWALFGLGAFCGPFLVAWLVRHLGWQQSLLLALALKALAVTLALLAADPLARSLSSFLVGALVPGVVALTSGRLAELGGPDAHRQLWGRATAAFAAAQALSGYLMSLLFILGGSYRPLFLLGGLLLASGFALLLFGSRHLQPSRYPE